MKSGVKFIGIGIGALLILILNSMFVVDMRELVFITQFGKPVGQPITEAGLHFKLPFIQKTTVFDKRFLEWDGLANDVTTKDKQLFRIDTYARWRIIDPLLFFQSVNNVNGAQTRLDDVLDGAARSIVAANNLVEIIRSEQREASADSEDIDDSQNTGALAEFTVGRSALESEILNMAKPKLEEVGIELLDFRFKRLNYSEDVKREILNRMKAERNRIADRYRSEGQGEAAKIIGQKERELKQITSDAYRQVQQIQGEADAEAVKIYADAYNSSDEARSFFQFQKTLEAYETSINSDDTLILSTKADFYNYLQNADGSKDDTGAGSETEK